jgi:hypothetical protein
MFDNKSGAYHCYSKTGQVFSHINELNNAESGIKVIYKEQCAFNIVLLRAYRG